MTRTRSLLSSLAAGAALVALTACGSTSTTSSPADDAPLPAATVPDSTVPTATIPPTTVPTITIPETTIPETTIPETTIPETPDPEPIDDIVTPTVPPATFPPIPRPTIAPVVVAAGPCGAVGAVPAGAIVESDRIVDVTGDGTADDHVLTYLAGDWTMRTTVDGVVSEVTVADVGPGAVRALGTADVAGLTAGNEIIATAGSGAYTQRIGIFGVDATGCLFRFADSGGNDLEFLSGASVAFGDRFACETHAVSAASWSLNDVDHTYDLGGAAYYESSPGVFTYLPASDDYMEGVAIDDLPDLFDCFGLTL